KVASAEAYALVAGNVANVGFGVVDPNVGQTFTLTTGVDNLVGTAGNDTFIGAETTYTDSLTPVLSGTFSVLDNVNGGAGTDTLNLAIQGGGGTYTTGAIAGATISGVEVLNIRAIQAEAADIITLNASTISGLTNVNADRATSTVTVTNLASGAQAGMIGNASVVNGALNAGWVAAATTATLNVSGGTTAGNVVLTGTGVTSTVINSTGSVANTIGTLAAPATSTSLKIVADAGLTTGAITAAAATSITVSGTASSGTATTAAGEATSAVRIGTAPATVTTIDASGLTAGGVAVTLTTGVTSFKGGLGNDAVTTAALTSTTASIIDAGAGTADVLTVANATHVDSALKANQYANFEVLDAGAVAVNTALFTNSTITALKIGGSTTAILSGLNAAQAGAITAYGDANAVYTVTGASTVGQLDTLKITADDGLTATNLITLANIQAAGVETINLVANDTLAVTTLVGATAMTSMNLTGTKAITITTNGLVLNVNTVIDATAATGAVTFDATLGATNGIAIKGSLTGVNTLTGTAQADTITGGAGNDILVGGAGNDTINGGAGNDIITGGAGADIINVGTGTDTIVLSAVAQTYSAATAATIVSGTTVLTGIDVVTGMSAGDVISTAGVSNTFAGAAATTIAGASGIVEALVRGNFAVATNIWTTSATGTDTLFVYDIDGAGANTVVEAVVLVGVVATGTAAAGLLTLA
ncbi:calcium-binding protein, partial [Aquabacterium sp.]|uniref:beta strand repeat-containing protein n=1 Tax=Aquabacterium sp. TaxID=1872578 RepID=UPI002488065F